MGCSFSKADAHGVSLPGRLRPILRQCLKVTKPRRHANPSIGSTPSKKKLLLHGKSEEESASTASKNVVSSHQNSIKKSPESREAKEDLQGKEIGVTTVVCDNNDHTSKKRVAKEGRPRDHGEKAETNADFISDDGIFEDEEKDNNERTTGGNVMDCEAFPGSPSFRVFFKDRRIDGSHDNGIVNADKKDDYIGAGSSNDCAPSSKEKSVMKEREKRGFRKMLPKGGQPSVRNLLSVTSCMTSSHRHSSHHNHRFVTPAANG